MLPENFGAIWKQVMAYSDPKRLRMFVQMKEMDRRATQQAIKFYTSHGFTMKPRELQAKFEEQYGEAL